MEKNSAEKTEQTTVLGKYPTDAICDAARRVVSTKRVFDLFTAAEKNSTAYPRDFELLKEATGIESTSEAFRAYMLAMEDLERIV
ncbi:MAG: hypothetical protein JRI34_00850 [Deltaproteobacteria bacterium]|nr:hypothetical protein [Deltaproteobacteria bacterium]